MLQATRVYYDADTATLDFTLSDGADYRITEPAHARALRSKISVGGMINEGQRWWLEKYRVKPETRIGLLNKLAALRVELALRRRDL